MSRTLKIGFVALLIALLIVSVGLNVILYQQGRDYYLQLNSVRLDPLGLSVYATREKPVNGERPIIVFFGDSRAADWTLPIGISGSLINRGISNQTSIQALGRINEDVLSLKPDVVVVQLGVNDLKTIPLFPKNKDQIITNLKTNLQRIVEQSVQNGAKVILTTIFPVGRVPLERSMFWSNDVALAIDEVNQYLASLAGDRVTIFDTTRTLANDDGTVNQAYSRDFLHLNAQGYAALNQELVHIISP